MTTYYDRRDRAINIIEKAVRRPEGTNLVSLKYHISKTTGMSDLFVERYLDKMHELGLISLDKEGYVFPNDNPVPQHPIE